MEVVAVILALLAVILLILLVISRRNAKTAASHAAVSRSALESEVTTAQRAKTRAQSEAEAAEKKAEETSAQAALDIAAAQAEAAATAERESTATAMNVQHREKIESLERYSVELTSDLAAAQERATTADTERLAAVAAAESAKADADAARAATGGTNAFAGSGVDPELLWALEITRSERTWRHSVAVDPNGPSPFPDAPDPLRFAVEVEAAAMREEVGAFINLVWDAEAVADPVRRLLVLRVANELLAAAAREPQPFEMIATGSSEITLRVRATEEGDRQIHIDPPRFGTDVISFTSDDEGISVTIR